MHTGTLVIHIQQVLVSGFGLVQAQFSVLGEALPRVLLAFLALRFFGDSMFCLFPLVCPEAALLGMKLTGRPEGCQPPT